MNLLFIFMRTLITYVLVFLIVLIFIVPSMFLLLLPQRYRYDNRLLFALLDYFYKAVVWASLLPVEVIGKKNIPKSPAIFVANHQSAFDIPLVGSLLNGYPHVWYVLEYFINTPVLGFFIRRMFVPVDQKNPAKAAQSLLRIIKFIKNNNRHMIIFPEGGRFTDLKIHDFFEGFAIIAKQTGRPVVPVYMPYNAIAYPPYSFLVRYHKIFVIVGPPLIMGPDESQVAFTNRVRDWFIKTSQNYI